LNVAQKYIFFFVHFAQYPGGVFVIFGSNARSNGRPWYIFLTKLKFHFLHETKISFPLRK